MENSYVVIAKKMLKVYKYLALSLFTIHLVFIFVYQHLSPCNVHDWFCVDGWRAFLFFGLPLGILFLVGYLFQRLFIQASVTTKINFFAILSVGIGAAILGPIIVIFLQGLIQLI